MGVVKLFQKYIGPGFQAATPGRANTGAILEPANKIGKNLHRVAHFIYDFAVDGGVAGEIIPAKTVILPANAILVGAILNPTTAVLAAAGAATVAVGTHAGSAANAIITATAKASWSINALLTGTVTRAAPVKMSAAGQISITVATNPLTAGVIEGWVEYFIASE